jgi:hypothetical protein
MTLILQIKQQAFEEESEQHQRLVEQVIPLNGREPLGQF